MAAEEWYWCKYSYTDKDGNTKINIDHTRIRWKPWEYYYDDGAREVWSDEEMRKYIKEGSLNSRETDRALRLRDEMKGIESNHIKFYKERGML